MTGSSCEVASKENDRRSKRWSVCGAQQAQPIAISGKSPTPKAAKTSEIRCRGLQQVAATPKW
jgi:hypothetical protein